MKHIQELEAADVYQRTDPAQFAFETTDDLQDLAESIGQARAVEAIQFGVGIERQGYNIFALGPTGMDKHGFVSQYFEGKAQAEPVPDDWCYVNNFAEQHKPRAIRLPAGKGVAHTGGGVNNRRVLYRGQEDVHRHTLVVIRAEVDFP